MAHRALKLFFFAAALAIAAGAAPDDASACRDPSRKVGAISVALESAQLSAAERAQITALRDAAAAWRQPGKYAEAQAAADKAIKLLKLDYREPPSSTRC